MSSLFGKVARFARSPQGRRAINQAMSFARSPEGRRKLQQARERVAARRGRPPKPKG